MTGIKLSHSIFLFLVWAFFPLHVNSQSNVTFPPPSLQPVIGTIETHEKIILDGKMNESIWEKAIAIKDFFRNDPRQGGDYVFHTEVKIVFDKRNLYFGIICKDPKGKKGIRVQDYRRDFVEQENDAFYIQLDPQNLKRYCVSFQVTPLSTQRDLQVFDDLFRDTDWDAPWRVKSEISDSGWSAEISLPFKSLRYERSNQDSVNWGVTFARVARRDFEQTVFPAIPQNISPYNMSYAASLKGLSVPPPSINLRIQPFGLYQSSRSISSNNVETKENKLKFGGDVKWAVNPHTVLDFTFNTDFAQADIDRAVNNLTRFNVLFPERRQFFLENQGIFAGTNVPGIRPFFSRTIGLSNALFNSDPVPIDGGVRYIDRDQKRTIAGLYIHQRGTRSQAASNFGIARYLKNYKAQNNIGIMLTQRIDEQDITKGFDLRSNTTLTLDGVIRPGPYVTIEYMASAARNNSNDSLGFASHFRFRYDNNRFFFFYRNRMVDEKYIPGMGFVFQNNVMHHQTVQFLRIRPKGKKWAWIREYELGFDVDYYHSISNFKFQQNQLYFFPLYIIPKNGGVIEYSIFPTWQNINFDFRIFNVPLAKKRYYYTRHEIELRSNQSKKIGGSARYVFGKYYNGKLQDLTLGLRLAPLPKLTLASEYILNRFVNFGSTEANFSTHLISFELRVALNANIQGSVFYQKNSFDKQGRWNVRGSWQFAPLSFIYIVFNESNYDHSTQSNRSVINKITFLKQF